MSTSCQWDDKAPQDLDEAAATTANVAQARVSALHLPARRHAGGSSLKMSSRDELRLTAQHLRQAAELAKDPAQVRDLHYITEMYEEELRQAEETGRGCDARLVTLLPSM